MPRDAVPEGRGLRGANPADDFIGANDDALVSMVASGDGRAWPVLLDRHLPPIVAYAWRMLGDRMEAEDVAQETFIRFLRKADEWQPGGPKLTTWLHRVAINLCIDRQRAKTRTPVIELIDTPDPCAGEAHLTRQLDLARTVQIALARLPERQQAALALVHYQGFTNAEAAAMLELSVEAVESLLARARRSLRRDLGGTVSELLGEN